MAPQEDKARTNPLSGVFDILGLPRPDEIIPMPVDIVEIADLPIITDIIKHE